MRNINIIKCLCNFLPAACLALLSGCATPDTPLDTALINGNKTEVLRLLNAQGGSQAEKDQALLRSLQYAGVLADPAKQLDIAKDLLAGGASLYSNVELLMTVAVNKPELVQFLADHGFDLNTRNNAGSALVHMAVTMDKDRSLRTLARNGANLNQKDANLLTPLGQAVYLWSGGGRMTSPEQQKKGETAAKTLIQLGARINEPFTVDRHTVLHEAARFNRPDIVRYLIAAGADQSIADKHNTTVAEQLEIAKIAAQIKEEARQRKLAEERADPGLMMSVIAIAGATAQNYAAAKQGSVPRQATSTALNEAGRTRAAGSTSSTATRTAGDSANAPVAQGYKDPVTESWQRQLAAPKYTENLGALRSQEATEAAARAVAQQNWENTRRRIESEHDRRLTYGRILSVASPQCAPTRGMKTREEPEGRLIYWSCGVAYSVELAGPRGTGAGISR